VTRASPSASRTASLPKAGEHAPSKPSRSPKRKTKKPIVPEVPGKARIIAIANQKGGVGKSTTAVSLGAALAEIGYRVLVADLDPQGNASTGLGIRHDARDVTVYDVVVAEAEIGRAIVPTPLERLHAVPATIDLAGAEIELVSQFSRETRLKKAIEPVAEGVYDFIILDCPPSLGLLRINALTAAEELIVPIQCEYYALEGLGQLLRNVSLVQQNINAGLKVSGIVMTMFDPRTKLSEQVVREVQRYFGDLVYDVIIPRTVRLSEAPGFGQPITAYDARSRGAEAYRELAREVAIRPPPDTPMPSFDDIPMAVTIDEMPNTGDRGPEPELEEEPDDGSAPEPTGEQVEAKAAEDVETQAVPEVAEDRPVPPRAVAPPSEDEGHWVDPQPEPEPRVKAPSRPARPGELPERRVVVIDENLDIDIEAGQEEAPPPAPTDDEERPGMAEIGATLEAERGPKRRWRMFRKGDDR
jgi:chromosome partitioning protein